MNNTSAPETARTNISKIVELEEAGEENRPRTERTAAVIGRFAGTLSFVVGQLTFVAAWVTLNSGALPGFTAFDPFPFSLLSTVLSLQGVLLAAFVLIRQNRMSAISERRSHLGLQISLLSEKEATKVIQMLQRISRHMGIHENVSDAEVTEFAEATAVEDLARELDDRLPSEKDRRN